MKKKIKFEPVFIGYPYKQTKLITKIKEKKKITETEFFNNYEQIKKAIRSTINWQNYNRANHGYDELYDDMNFSTLDVVSYNDWAKPEKMSDKLKLFLKLNGEKI